MNIKDVNLIIHYGAPHSIDDYFQESRRGRRSGDHAHSIVFWKPIDCPVKIEPTCLRDQEHADVRKYLENTTTCRRKWLLEFLIHRLLGLVMTNCYAVTFVQNL